MFAVRGKRVKRLGSLAVDAIVLGPGEGERARPAHRREARPAGALGEPRRRSGRTSSAPAPLPRAPRRHVLRPRGGARDPLRDRDSSGGRRNVGRVPPGVVHGFTAPNACADAVPQPARAGLRFHRVPSPAHLGGQVGRIRQHRRRQAAGPAEADIVEKGSGERLEASVRTITVRSAQPQLCFVEFEGREGFGPSRRISMTRRSIRSTCWRASSASGRTAVRRGSGRARSSLRPGSEHGILRVESPVRFLNFHAPDDGFRSVHPRRLGSAREPESPLRGDRRRPRRPGFGRRGLADDGPTEHQGGREADRVPRVARDDGVQAPDEAEQEKALALEGARVYEPADNGGRWAAGSRCRRRTKTGGPSSSATALDCEQNA